MREYEGGAAALETEPEVTVLVPALPLISAGAGVTSRIPWEVAKGDTYHSGNPGYRPLWSFHAPPVFWIQLEVIIRLKILAFI